MCHKYIMDEPFFESVRLDTSLTINTENAVIWICWILKIRVTPNGHQYLKNIATRVSSWHDMRRLFCEFTLYWHPFFFVVVLSIQVFVRVEARPYRTFDKYSVNMKWCTIPNTENGTLTRRHCSKCTREHKLLW